MTDKEFQEELQRIQSAGPKELQRIMKKYSQKAATSPDSPEAKLFGLASSVFAMRR